MAVMASLPSFLVPLKLFPDNIYRLITGDLKGHLKS